MENVIDAPNGAKLVSGAIIGMDYRIVIINDKTYLLYPPTIHRLAGACYFLSDMKEANTLKEMITLMGDSEKLAKALSWFIQGDESLSEEFANAKIGEVVEGIEAAFSMINAENFLMLSVLLKSARMLIAKQK